MEAWRGRVAVSRQSTRDLGKLVFLPMDYEFPGHRLPFAMFDQLESG